MSDLQKYDMEQVRAHLERTMVPQIKNGKCDKDEVKIAMKSYTANGYKNISFMAFGDSYT